MVMGQGGCNVIDLLRDEKRLLMEVDLRPVQGERFQPTGFPDIGAATYQLPDGTKMLLVESPQSMANHLESSIAAPDGEVISELEGISYIRSVIEGKAQTKTTSLIEAHRINSPWIINKMKDTLAAEAGLQAEKVTSIDWQRVARMLFKYDINTLLHGVFLVALDSRLKVPRALSAFIEARNAQEVVSGGVKFDHIDPSGKLILPEKKSDKDVIGNVPFHRVEYTTENITAYFNLDLGLLRSYRLPPEGFDLLVYLSLFKVLRFLSLGTRLRTACDLKQTGPIRIQEPEGFKLADISDILRHLQEKIATCRSFFADPPVTEVKEKAIAPKKEASKVAEVEDDQIDT